MKAPTISKSALRQIACADKIENIIIQKNGTLLTDKSDVKNYKTKIHIQCQFGNIWNPIVNDAINDHWCPCHNCGRNKPYDLERVQLWIKDKFGGKILSTVWHGTKYSHTFKCRKGHIFEKKGRAVIFDETWCPTCSKKAKQQKIRTTRYEELKEIVAMKKAKLITKQYILSTDKFEILCSCGFNFKLNSKAIKERYLCPGCNRQ